MTESSPDHRRHIDEKTYERLSKLNSDKGTGVWSGYFKNEDDLFRRYPKAVIIWSETNHGIWRVCFWKNPRLKRRNKKSADALPVKIMKIKTMKNCGSGRSDCVARAISLATGKSYDGVFEALSRAKRVAYPGSRNASHGVSSDVWQPILLKMEWAFLENINDRFALRAGRVPAGRCILNMPGHLVACINGIIYDTYDSVKTGRGKILGVYVPKEYGAVQ